MRHAGRGRALAGQRGHAHLGFARWFHRGDDFDVLQLIWPNKSGQWPCDEAASAEFRAWQIALFRCACAADHHPMPVPADEPPPPEETWREGDAN